VEALLKPEGLFCWYAEHDDPGPYEGGMFLFILKVKK
jgi:hypothetical protein